MEEVIGKIYQNFLRISAIPRCSKDEMKIGKWLGKWAQEHNLEHKHDPAGNLVIKVPGSRGYQNSEPVAIQGHMDMVCEKVPGSEHDFSSDGIEVIRKNDWLMANGTTLGADNGIALAIGMTLVEENVVHPPLELLFTVDEETGLTGASSLTPDFIESKRLINLDSEEEGVFVIGCAGGKDVRLYLPVEFEPTPENSEFLKFGMSGLRGGHSGVDIDKNFASANKVLSRLLYRLKSNFSFNLVSICGGNAHNSLAREGEVVICSYPEDREDIISMVKALEDDLRYEYRNQENGLEILIEKADPKDEVLTENSTSIAVNLLMSLPHGVISMSPEISGLVETSCNLAIIGLHQEQINILLSIRSSAVSRIETLASRVEAMAELSGAKVKQSDGYPAWQVNTDSKLLQESKKVYSDLFDKEAEVSVIHAGLECGVIGEKFPDMEMISFGPTILNAHSPEEKLNLPSCYRIWSFLVSLLSELK